MNNKDAKKKVTTSSGNKHVAMKFSIVSGYFMTNYREGGGGGTVKASAFQIFVEPFFFTQILVQA